MRPGLQAWNKTQAPQAFALRNDLPVVMVLGGSRGARSINQALQAVLPELLRQVQVLHISGTLDWSAVEASRNNLPVELQARYRAYPYLHKEMGAALRAADLVVSRAGASVLGEYPLFGLPAILLPYPYAWRYQRVNAQYLVRQGAAVQLNDADLAEQLLPTIRELLADRQRRERLVLRNERLHALEDRQEPRVQSLPSGRPPAAGGHRLQAPAASVDDHVPARSRPWVDAEDLHVKKVFALSDIVPRSAGVRRAEHGAR